MTAVARQRKTSQENPPPTSKETIKEKEESCADVDKTTSPPPPPKNASDHIKVSVQNVEDDEPEFSQKPVPTPELLYLRRASLHVPLSSSFNFSATASETNPKSMLPIEHMKARSASLSMRDLHSMRLPDTELLPPVSPETCRRHSGPSIPSKLTLE